MNDGQALRLLRVTGCAVLLLSVAMLLVKRGTPVERNTPGFTDPVVGLELASEPAHVLGILGGPTSLERADAVRRMVLVTRIDFLFLIAYPAFHLAMAWLLLGRGAVSRSAAIALVVLPLVMAVGDALENREILVLSDLLDPEAMLPALRRLRLFTTLKWDALFADSALLAALIWRRTEWWRLSAPLFALGAVLGALAAVHPPVIEWAVGPLGVAWATTLAWAFARPATA
jgi:hypothetical protein